MTDGQVVNTAKFIEHESLASLFAPLAPYLRRRLEAHSRREAAFEGTSIEQYAEAIMGRVSEIDNCFVAMQIAVQEIFRLSENLPLRSAELYRYHYENYLLRLSGIFDRVCRLVGQAVKIESEMLNSIRTNSTVLAAVRRRHPEIHQSLTKIQRLLDEKRNERNLVAHAEAYSNPSLGLFIAIEAVASKEISRSDVDPPMRDHFTKEAGLLKALMSEVKVLIWKLIDRLAPVFRVQV